MDEAEGESFGFTPRPRCPGGEETGCAADLNGGFRAPLPRPFFHSLPRRLRRCGERGGWGWGGGAALIQPRPWMAWTSLSPMQHPPPTNPHQSTLTQPGAEPGWQQTFPGRGLLRPQVLGALGSGWGRKGSPENKGGELLVCCCGVLMAAAQGIP